MKKLAVSVIAVGVAAIGMSAPAMAQDEVTPAPSDTVTAQAGDGIKVKWDWSMPSGMIDDMTFVPTTDESDPDFWEGGSYVPGPDGIPDDMMRIPGHYPDALQSVYGKLPKNDKFKVVLDASGTSGGHGRLTCHWKVTADKTYKAKKACSKTVSMKLPEGKQKLRLKVTDKEGHSKTVASHVRVKNTLIAIMGDSFASGEGIPPFTNPDIRTNPNARQVAWDMGGCNRTRWSGFVRSAQALESVDNRSNVTLVDVACAGGEVQKGHITSLQKDGGSYKVVEYETGGILYPQSWVGYDGLPRQTEFQPPQIDQVNAITRGNTVDLTLLSIGGNDAGLSDIALTCTIYDYVIPLTLKTPSNCYDQIPLNLDGKPNARPLYEVANDNLEDLQQRYDRMAPCFGAGSGPCKTWKLTSSGPATEATNAQPVYVSKPKNLVHAVYPDLTTTTDAGAIVPCFIGALPQSPMNQIDNTWAWDSLYVGQPGTTITLPTQYSPPLKTPSPASFTQTGSGLVPLIERNHELFGWTAASSFLEASRGHGLCAGDEAWEYGVTESALPQDKVVNLNSTLHPNNSGQEGYEEMLSGIGLKRTRLPVSKPKTIVVPKKGLG